VAAAAADSSQPGHTAAAAAAAADGQAVSRSSSSLYLPMLDALPVCPGGFAPGLSPAEAVVRLNSLYTTWEELCAKQVGACVSEGGGTKKLCAERVGAGWRPGLCMCVCGRRGWGEKELGQGASVFGQVRGQWGGGGKTAMVCCSGMLHNSSGCKVRQPAPMLCRLWCGLWSFPGQQCCTKLRLLSQ
jgi:hypothetical protein